MPPADTWNSLDHEAEDAPERIGAYRILSQIGEGGFGVVYEAEQTEPVRRRVALKLIKRGMDSKAIVARFEAERQALALMDHPCVAKIFDGGVTEDGRPYFVMELVRGLPLTEHCDRNRLSVDDRIELFISVCNAVQHAHAKGVIHRDLKPSNVLIEYEDAKSTPKVIDFGVAKALSQRLTEATIFTEQGVFIGTPEYMSPEQAGMSEQGVDTRSDVYSLGVMLYELLTGTRPFESDALRKAGLGEIQRIIREVEPPKPSTRLGSLAGSDASVSLEIAGSRRTEVRSLASVLRRDLDWVVMKCLEKDRERRYETANALAMELGRFLSDEPVLAGPPSVKYRAGKFVRRNRGGVIAGGVIAATLIVATGVSVWFGVEAERSRAREAERASELSKMSAFQGTMLSTVNAKEMGLAILDAVQEHTHDVPEWNENEIGSGDRQSNRIVTGYDPTGLARRIIDEHILARAVDSAAEQFAEEPKIQAQLLASIGDTYRLLGLYEPAMPVLSKAVELFDVSLGPHDSETISARLVLAFTAMDLAEFERASTLLNRVLSDAEHGLGVENIFAPTATAALGSVLLKRGLYLDAEKLLIPYIQRLEYRLASNPEDENLRADYVVVIEQAAMLYFDQGEFSKAEPYYIQALEEHRRVHGENHYKTANTLNSLALVYRREGDAERALELMKKAHTIQVDVLGETHQDALGTMSNIANVHLDLGNSEESEQMHRFVLEHRQQELGTDHPAVLFSMMNVANVLFYMDRYAEAAQFQTDAISGARKLWPSGSWYTGAFLVDLGKTLLRAQKFAEAETSLKEGVEILVEFSGWQNPSSIECTQALIDLYTTWHAAEPDASHDAKAAEWQAKLGVIQSASAPTEDED